jgi:hypothetical protein
MFAPKIKIDKGLHARLKRYATVTGYSSVDEFATHVLEKELKKIEEAATGDEEAIKKRLKGLGYIS